MFLVFYIIRLLLLPHGVRIFGTNLHRFEKFGLWCQRHLPHRLWRKGTYQQSFLGGKLGAFCGLHLIAKWSCFICPYSIFVFFFFLKKSCLDLKSGAVMALWCEKVTRRRWKRFITGLQASLFQHFCEMLHTWRDSKVRKTGYQKFHNR